MAAGLTRRRLLTSIGTATAAAAVPTARGRTDAQTDGAWPTFGYDETNRGYVPETTGPTRDVGGRWRVETDGAVGASASVVDGTVYVGDDRGNLYALATDDGTEQWRFEAGGQINSTPAVVDETIYFGSGDNSVYAIDRADGTENWQFETDDQVVASPTVVDGTVYVGSKDFRLYAIDASDGTEQWSAIAGNAFSAAPAVVDGTVYVGSEDRSLYALDADDGTLLWEFETDAELTAAVSVDPASGTVYAASLAGTVYAVDTASGDQQWQASPGGRIVGSPAVTDEMVYVGSRDNALYALDATDGTGRWSYDTTLRVVSAPSVAGDAVYVGDQIGNIYGVSARDGSELWRFETQESITTAPAVVDGVVYLGSESGVLYALEEGAELPSETPTDGQSGDESGGPDLRFLAFPVFVASMVGLFVGTLYAANRAGLFKPLEDAAPDPPPAEELTTGPEQDEKEEGAAPGDADPAIWEVVMTDVIGRAAETRRTATQDLLVKKYVDPDTLSAPMVAYEIESLRSEPVRVRISEPIDPAEVDADAIGSLPGGEGWEIAEDRLVFETDLEPGQITRTLVARRDLSPERTDELLASPTVDIV